MRISEFRKSLAKVSQVRFRLEDGTAVPEHFHVTEVGAVTRHFIDCGGTLRNERKINLQLYAAGDTEHRLRPLKLLNIIALSEIIIGTRDDEIEVEYQGNTIGKYGLGFNGTEFILKNTQTACLASDKCGIEEKMAKKPKVKLSQLQSNSCTPGSGCC